MKKRSLLTLAILGFVNTIIIIIIGNPIGNYPTFLGGAPASLIGLLTYAFLATLSWKLFTRTSDKQKKKIGSIILFTSTAGTSILLTDLLFKIIFISHICPFCIASACIMLLIFIFALISFAEKAHTFVVPAGMIFGIVLIVIQMIYFTTL